MYFHPNCTLPAHVVSYVGSPNVRSTLDILWSSLATIIACTYSVLHLNVPEQRLGCDPGWKGDLKWSAVRLRKSIEWTIITIFAPEYELSRSWVNLSNARRELKLLRGTLPKDDKTWSVTHMLFADMGGFILRYKQAREQQSTQVWHLDAHSLRRAIEEGYLPRSIMPAEDVLDRSKSDLFTKIITLVQITYFVIGVLARASEGLSISQLEIGVTGFVACSFVTYCLNISKPKGVCTAITIKDYESEPLPPRYKELMIESNLGSLWGDAPKPGRYIVNDVDRSAFQGNITILVLVTSLLIGAVHLAAWNFEFPTPADSWLWRGAALTSAAIGIPWTASISLASWIEEFFTIETGSIDNVVQGGLLGLYVISRLVLIVEMFRCLFYATPDTFISTWTANVPHFG